MLSGGSVAADWEWRWWRGCISPRFFRLGARSHSLPTVVRIRFRVRVRDRGHVHVRASATSLPVTSLPDPRRSKVLSVGRESAWSTVPPEAPTVLLRSRPFNAPLRPVSNASALTLSLPTHLVHPSFETYGSPRHRRFSGLPFHPFFIHFLILVILLFICSSLVFFFSFHHFFLFSVSYLRSYPSSFSNPTSCYFVTFAFFLSSPSSFFFLLLCVFYRLHYFASLFNYASYRIAFLRCSYSSEYLGHLCFFSFSTIAIRFYVRTPSRRF